MWIFFISASFSTTPRRKDHLRRETLSTTRRLRLAVLPCYGFAMNGNGSGISVKLDTSTVQVLERLAQTWGVSKQNAVRRAVEQADEAAGSPKQEGRLEAFKELQRRLRMTPSKAAEWQGAVREARR